MTSHALFDHLLFQRRLRPNAPAVLTPTGLVVYARLVRDVDGLATELLARGLTRADMVGLHLGYTYLHLLAILALERLGIPSMSFASADLSTAPPIPPVLRLTAVVSAAPAPAPTPTPAACRWIGMTELHRPSFGKPDGERLAAVGRWAADDLVRIGWSSGTTGGMKGAPVTRALQARRVGARRLLHAIGPRTRYFTGMPFSQPFGYNVPLAVLCAGGLVILPGSASDFVGFANAHGVTLTGATPSMAAELIGPRDPLRRLETVEGFEILGAHPSPELARDIRFFLTGNVTLGYGTTETDRIASADAGLSIDDPAAVGYPIPGVAVEIVDADDRALPAGQEGIVRVRSPQAIAGYFHDEAATRRNFRDGWFLPGDLGMLTRDGLLRVTGRVEEVIVHDGAVVSPTVLEATVRDVPGLREVAVFALPGDAALGAALVLEAGADARAVRDAVAARLGEATRLFAIERLPRNESGKLVRRELIALALNSLQELEGARRQ